MKKKGFLLLVLFAASLFSTNTLAKENVVTLFNKLLSTERPRGIIDYKIDYKNRKYVLGPKDVLGPTHKLVVDTRNGFIYINDYRGAEEGNMIINCALYTGKNNNRFLGISYYSQGESTYNTHWDFYKFNDNKLIKVTDKIINGFRDIEVDFVNVMAKRNERYREYIPELFKNKTLLLLPRYGTDFEILLFNNALIFYYDEVYAMDKSKKKMIMTILKNIKYNVKIYKWQNEYNRFVPKRLKYIDSDTKYYKKYESSVTK